MPDRTVPAELPNAELEVLAFLSRSGSATARQVQDGLAASRPMTDGATVALLKRLKAKGLVQRHKPRGKAIIYSPTRKAQPAYRRVVRGLLDRVFGGDGARLVVSLLEEHPPTEEELDRIEAALERIKAHRKSLGRTPGGKP